MAPGQDSPAFPRYPSFDDESSLSNVVQLEVLQAALARGLALRLCAHGVSMAPQIRDGDVLTVVPLEGRHPRLGEVVACVLPANGRLVFHRVVECGEAGWLLRGDNCRDSDGAITTGEVLGAVASVERDGREVRLGSGRGAAWLSRTGTLRALNSPRRLWWHTAVAGRRRLQSLSVYRASAAGSAHG